MAGRDREVKVRILGEDRASPAFKSAAQGLDAFGPAGERASGALGRVQGFLNGFGAIGQKAAGAVDSAVAGLGSMAPAATAAAAGVGALVVGVGALAKAGIENFVSNAQKVRDFGRAAGTSAEESSQFVSALDDMGIASEQGASSIFKLAKNIETNEGALAKLGVTAVRTKDGSVDLKETFLGVADAFAAQPDPAKRAELAMAAFGKSGAALIPILEKGREGIEELFGNADLAFTQDQLNQAEDYRLAMDHLGDAVGKLQRGVGGGLVPIIADLADGMATGVEKVEQLSAPLGGITGTIDKLTRFAPGIGAVRSALEFVGGGAKDAGTAEAELARSVATANAEIESQALSAEEAAKALDAMATASAGLVDAQFAVAGAQDRLQGALGDLAEKQSAAAAAAAQHGANSQEATAALEDLDDATRGAGEAANAVAHQLANQAIQQLEANGATLSGAEKAAIYKQKLIETANQIGGPTGAALLALADQIRNVPDGKTIEFKVDAAQAFAELAEFNRAMAASGFNTRQVSRGPVGSAEFTSRDAGGKASKRFAHGGRPPVGEAVVVGEEGPEVVTFGRPATVHPNGTSVVPVAAGTAGGVVENHFHFPNFVGDTGDLMRAIETNVAKKARNGDPLWAPLAPRR